MIERSGSVMNNFFEKAFLEADEKSKDITKRLIHLEEQLATDIRQFL